MKLTYNPEVFKVNDIAAAMRIILTPQDASTEERWRTETPYLGELIGSLTAMTPDTIVLDYGCGIGRMAKEIIARYGCRVIGVDISESMRALAVMYVGSERFMACAPDMVSAFSDRGLRVDVALSIWVLQHCLDPANDIARIRRIIKPGGNLFVLNNVHRAVPTQERAWANDGIDIKKILTSEFQLAQAGQLPPAITSEKVAELTYWMLLLQPS